MLFNASAKIEHENNLSEFKKIDLDHDLFNYSLKIPDKKCELEIKEMHKTDPFVFRGNFDSIYLINKFIIIYDSDSKYLPIWKTSKFKRHTVYDKLILMPDTKVIFRLEEKSKINQKYVEYKAKIAIKTEIHSLIHLHSLELYRENLYKKRKVII